MAQEHDYVRSLRAETLLAELVTASTLCAIAERDIQTGNIARTLENVIATAKILHELALALERPDHLSERAAAELRDFVAKVITRLKRIEEAALREG